MHQLEQRLNCNRTNQIADGVVGATDFTAEGRVELRVAQVQFGAFKAGGSLGYGRLSRIGQSHDVHVFNLIAAGTVEAAVLHLLDAKLSMFEMVIGEIDMVLGNMDDDREFHEVVADVWSGSSDDDDFAMRMEDLGNRLLSAKQAYLEQRAHDDRLFGNKFAPEK